MISAVIPTRNRAELLAKALESLTRQTLPASEFEVLVVDNGSTDHTPRVVEEFASRLPLLRRIYDPTPGLHTGRHAGMRAAQSDVVVFGEDDIEAFPTWLEAMLEPFTDQQTVMAGGNILPMFLAEPPAWVRKLWQRREPGGRRLIAQFSVMELPVTNGFVSPSYIWGGNMAIRKAVLLKAGGFHPDGMPNELIRFRGDGETHVSRYVAAQGLLSAFRAGASIHHKVMPERMTFEYFRRRGFTQGISDSYTALRARNIKEQHRAPSLLDRLARRVKYDAHDLMGGADVRTARRQFKLGRREGYAFHQKAYREDPAVREWVHKPDYL